MCSDAESVHGILIQTAFMHSVQCCSGHLSEQNI